MTTGEKILFQRKKAGLTQKALGKLCNMPDSQIRQYELGKVEPKLENLRRIASALQISISDLVADWGNFSQDEILSDSAKSAILELAMKKVEKLQNIEDENGMLNQDLLEKELDSIIEITTKAGAANKALLNAEIKQCMDKMLTLILKLNDTGRKEAIKRVSELTKLSEYMGVDLNILLEPYTKPDEPPQE